MRYFTWNTVWDSESEYGTTPESSVTIGTLEGGFEYQGTSIVGYGSDNVDISNLQKWSVVEITQAETLNLAKSLNNNCYINDEGKIQAPKLLLA
jgi:hypothetical protein